MTGRAPLALTMAALVEAAIARLIASPTCTVMLAVIEVSTPEQADAFAAFLPEGADDLQGSDAVDALEALRTAAPWGQDAQQAHEQHRSWRAVEGHVGDAIAALEQAFAACPESDLRITLEMTVSGLLRLRQSAQRRERQAGDQADALNPRQEILAALDDIGLRLDVAGQRLNALEVSR